VSSLAELTAEVRAFARDRDWQQFHTPKNLSMALAAEVGELLAEFQWLTPEQSAAVLDDPVLGPRVRAELGDVTIYLVRLADVLGLDLIETARTKLAEAATRYPVEAARGSARKRPSGSQRPLPVADQQGGQGVDVAAEGAVGGAGG
jgi:NTP pyrophosphatase (non-canonical NTP hydrolase)